MKNVRIRLKANNTTVVLRGDRLYRVPKTRATGPDYTRGEIAEYLGIPTDRATKMIATHKLLNEKQLDLLRRGVTRKELFKSRSNKYITPIRVFVNEEYNERILDCFCDLCSDEDLTEAAIFEEATRLAQIKSIEVLQNAHPNWSKELIRSQFSIFESREDIVVIMKSNQRSIHKKLH